MRPFHYTVIPFFFFAMQGDRVRPHGGPEATLELSGTGPSRAHGQLPR